jgi:hypothetical protein
MIDYWRKILWQQFGASIDMLENSIVACPERIWGDRSRQPEYWYITYHTLFFLDFYLSETADGFVPPAPFGLEELDPAGVLPPRVYTKDELLAYLNHGRNKCRRVVQGLTEEKSRELRDSLRPGLTVTELLLYTMRHVQHHAAQLNLILRQTTDSAPRWVSKAKIELDDK